MHVLAVAVWLMRGSSQVLWAVSCQVGFSAHLSDLCSMHGVVSHHWTRGLRGLWTLVGVRSFVSLGSQQKITTVHAPPIYDLIKKSPAEGRPLFSRS